MSQIKRRLKKAIPPKALNATLLRFPRLYSTSIVNYETNLTAQRGVEDLLSQLQLAVAVPGDIAECGSSRCGGTVLMAKRLEQLGVRRQIYACDSFEGFDLDELRRERTKGLTTSSDDAFTSTSYDYVTKKLARLGVDDVVTPVKGYFEATLPSLEGALCMVFIDCDLRDSLVYCADTLWDQLSPGGRIVFDDYTSDEYLGAREGVDQLVADRGDAIAEHGLLNRLYYIVKR